ncbi:MAG TPA: 1-acyl-sn-glycerol-3-phosphate acyltransferase, partial [Patescibacteria group bacterium]
MKKISHLPILGHAIETVDNEIECLGYQKAMMQVLLKTGAKVNITKKDKITKILKEEAVLVVANHPAEADVPLLLSALDQRDDTYLIMNSGFVSFCPSFNKHIIPVHIAHNLIHNSKDNLKFRLLKKIHQSMTLTPEEAHRKNVESIKSAAEKIDNKALVAIFPGAGGEDGKWKSGVGYLISQVKNKNNVKIVMAYIEGTSNKDYFRIIPGASKLLPTLRVRFSEPLEMDIFKDDEAKTAAQKLETEY